MNVFFSLWTFFLLSVSLFADNSEKKWIPIQPQNFNEKRAPELNTSKTQADAKMSNNLQIIKNVLDHIDKTEIKKATEKTWYSMEPSEE
jgi:hypothetical protein